eukprot:g454.t1
MKRADVQSTARDAARCKWSMVEKGYMRDDYVKCFVSNVSRKCSPLINRGTFARTYAIDAIARQFLQCKLKSGNPRQILSLGAGDDTLYWRLRGEHIFAKGGFFEIDFQGSVDRKRRIISANTALRSFLDDIEKRRDGEEGGTDPANVSEQEEVDRQGEKGSAATVPKSEVHSKYYHMIGADLSDIEYIQHRLESAGFNPHFPTLVIAECALVYMPPKESSRVVSWCGDWLRRSVFVSFEPFRPFDKYGKMMLLNFKRRGCDLRTMEEFPSLDAQRKRYLDSKWKDVRVTDMLRVFNEHIEPDTIKRVARLEIFDEFEEWRLIQSHYVLAMALPDAELGGAIGFMKGTLKDKKEGCGSGCD